MEESKERTIEDVNKDIEVVKKNLENLYNEKLEFEHKELNLDFYEGKYIEYDDHVMYVEDVFRNNVFHKNFEFSYLLRGLGFYSCLVGYGDATDVEWGYWHELYIDGHTKSELEDKLKKIKIITKEEYSEKFDKMVLEMIEFNKKALSKR